MKKLLSLLFIFTTISVSAQIYDPVSWEFSQKQVSSTEIELQFKAEIEENWHLYSQDIPASPPATTFTFIINGDTSIKKINEPNAIEEYDSNFEMVLKYFADEVIFKHTIDLNEGENITIDGYVDFMVCDDKQCLPPDYEEYTFTLKLIESFETDILGCMDESQSNYNPKATVNDGSCYLLGCTDSNAINYNSLSTKLDNSCKYSEEEHNHNIYDDPLVDLDNPIANCGNQKEESNTLWGIFLLGLLGGIIALITPCVFPMIPLTVSFFTKGKSEKGIFNAAMYGFFIMLIYFLLSIPFHIMPNIDPEILNQISTNTWLNLLFFVIFIAFAFSFFGYYELTLPSKWGNKADSGSNVGGLIGIFFMALTLAIVSFSCTGPILGTLLAGTLGGDVSTISFLGIEFKMVATKLTVGMTGFGLALGFPFAIFALFPRLLNALPQSGGWLNSVKVVLGFVEVALAIKFLSIADNTNKWGLIQRETFFLLWFIVGVLTVLYLFGKIKFPHDTPLKKISKIRYGFIAFFTVFTIYLIPGIFGSHLNWWEHRELSGFPPPYDYSYTYPKADVFDDYFEAIEYAKEVDKPIFIDFTGYGCVNCRKMEETVFKEKEVKEYINLHDASNSQFVICQLYVDEKTLLDKTEIVIVPTSDGGVKKKELKTIGEKWSTLQAVTYGSSSQPYYVLYHPEKGLLTNPIGYTPDADEFKEWLESGLEAYNKKE
jgi:thiol:disulfide interchange protein